MEIVNFIDKKMDEYRDSKTGKLSLITDDFIFSYGPFMCMYRGGYENECDEISRYSVIMRVMVHAAYLIRKITSGITYEDAKKTIKEFIISVDNNFDDQTDEKESLINFAKKYLEKIRAEQKENKSLESYMTNVSSIVPYETPKLKKKDPNFDEEEFHADNAEIIEEALNSYGNNKVTNQAYLKSLLLNNLGDIMMNNDLCIILFDDSEENINLANLDKYIKKNSKVSPDVIKYYFLAGINFYKIPIKKVLKYLDFFKTIGDFSKMLSYEAFESTVNMMAGNTSVNNIPSEVWDDPTLDEKEDNAVKQILQSHEDYGRTIANTTSRYNFGSLNDYINTQSYMKFEEYPNRLFISSLSKANIININNMGNDRVYYEMSNNTIACPFMDLRDYTVKVVVLHSDVNKIEIIHNITDLY